MSSNLLATDEIAIPSQPRCRRRYSTYRDTGVPWIGEIPAGWTTKRLRWTILTARNGIWGAEPDGENDIPCVRVADFDRVSFRVTGEVPTLRSVSPSERRGRILEKGDLLLEKSGGGELQPVGAVAIYDSDMPAVCSNFLARLVASPDCDGRFLSYLHAHLYSARVNIRSIKQTTGIQNLDAYSYYCEPVPIPPLAEQRAIAAFLDREAAKVDELIAKKQRLIDMLSVQRAALLNGAVTKGLNADVPTRPSGVAWLDDIPSHWVVRNFRYSAQIINGQVDPEDPRYSSLPLIAPNHIESRTGRLLDYSSAADQSAESGKYPFQTGNVLYSKIRPALAKVCIAPEPGLCSADMYPITPRADLRPKFLAYYMLSDRFTNAVVLMSDRVAMPKMNRRDLGAFAVLVPPLSEQDEIVKRIETHHARIDRSSQAVANAIRKLAEYRSALISAAVTGQIDVRHYREEAPCP